MIKYGDRTAIMLGGLPNYSYYKTQYKEANPTATEQEAIDYAIIKFEKDTKRTQQSQDLQDKDIYQNANPLSRSLNMFLTTPKQYLRKEIIAIRNLYRKISQMDAKAGKGTIGQNLRTFAMYHIMMPVIFQYVTLGLPGLLRDFRDEDDDDLIRAAVIGNLNGLFIVGQLIQYIADNIQNKPWAGQVPSIPIIEAEIRRMFPDLYEFEREQTKELRELEKDLRDLEKELLDEIFQ